MILGKYDFGDHIYIDSKYGFDKEDVKLHEITHHAITQGSLYGIMMIILKYLNNLHLPQLANTLIILRNACETAQEMTAMYSQCLFHKLKSEAELDVFLNKIRESDYYRKYCFSEFEPLLKRRQYSIDGISLLSALAISAMNVEIDLFADIDLLDTEQIQKLLLIKKEQVNPDVRFKKLCKAALSLLNTKADEISLNEIIELSRISCFQRTYDNITNLIEILSAQLAKYTDVDFNALKMNIEDLRNDDATGRPNSNEIVQRIIPLVLNEEYTHEARFEVTGIDYQMSSVTLALYDKSFKARGISGDGTIKDILLMHQATIGWHYPLLIDRNTANEFLRNFLGEIIVFTEDYDAFNKGYTFKSQRRVFYRFDGQYSNFIKQIRSNDKTLKIHLHEINEDIFCILILSNPYEIFFTLQFKEILHLVIDDIKNKRFTYVNVTGDNKAIDNCFYLTDTDWCRYEDVVIASVNRNLMDFSTGLPALGHRFNLE